MEEHVDCLQLYLLNNDASEPAKLAHSLKLNLDGFVGVHVIDNMVVAHHMSTDRSYLFDIRLAQQTVVIEPLTSTSIIISPELKFTYSQPDDLIGYKQSWALFGPNIIADARFGIFTKLELTLDRSADFIEDKVSYPSLINEHTISRCNSFLSLPIVPEAKNPTWTL